VKLFTDKKQLSKRAIQLSTGVVLLMVGAVAAQVIEEPWWTEWDIADSADVVTMDGSVAVNLGAQLATGSILKAKANYPTTGEYIGCSVTAIPDNGQFLTCVARDAAGEQLFCESIIAAGPTDFTLRQQTILMAAASINENSFMGFSAAGGECTSVTVSNSSADFLAAGSGSGGGVESCTSNNSIDLGAFGSAPVSVVNDSCVTVTQFAQPNFPYGPNRTMQLQNPAGTTAYPLAYEFQQTCTGAAGEGSFAAGWNDQYLPGLSDACPLYIKLGGDGSGTIELAYF